MKRNDSFIKEPLDKSNLKRLRLVEFFLINISMPPRKVLLVDWHAVNGAAQGRRKLILGTNVKGTYTCPVKLCLHTDLRSRRGTKRHIETRHPWYYYFDKQPG